MSSSKPLSLTLPFLCPTALPRPSTITRFLSLSNTRAASTTSIPPIPPSSTSKPSSSTTKTTTTTTTTTTAAKTADQPRPYHITKTTTRGLPVYQLSKRGGNLHQTRVRRIEGDIMALRTDLQRALGLGEREVVINQLTRHIIIKGHKKSQVVKFLEENKIAEDS